MPDVKYPKNPNSDTAFVEEDGKKARAIKVAVVDGTIDYPKNANSDSCYVTIDGQKQRALMVADVSGEGTVEYPNNPNSTKGYIEIDGKKQRVVLTATLAGGGSAPVIDELNVTPSTSAQTITAPSGIDGYSPVNVSAVTSSIDANIVAGNIKNGVTILGVTGSYTGGGSGKYKMFQRVLDDSNNDVGMVCGFHLDSNDNEYAVVALNAENRLDNGGTFLSTGSYVPNVPAYQDLSLAIAGKETATENTTEILDFATQNNLTSGAATFCRSKSFTIDGVVYYGQFPTVSELWDIMSKYDEIDSGDPTLASHPTLNVLGLVNIGSSTQYGATGGSWPYGFYWYFYPSNFSIAYDQQTTGWGVLPVLELPNA